MANVFGILTAITLALAAFIALKNKAQYEAAIVDTAAKKALLVKSQARLTVAKGTLEALPVEISGVNAAVEKLTAAEGAQGRSNITLKESVDAQTATVASNKEKLVGIRAKTSTSGNLSELAAKMRATNAELEELGQSIAGAEAKLANLTAQNSSSAIQVSNVQEKFESFANNQSLASLKTRVRSIYPNWGFVTLASGNNAGVVTNSTLNVVRGGETIAKLLVTAVESSSSSASIIPDSLAPDAVLMVGDRVEPGAKAMLKVAPVSIVPAVPAAAEGN